MLRLESSAGTFDCMPVARSNRRSNRPSGIVSALMESLLSTRSISGPLPAAKEPVIIVLKKNAATKCFISALCQDTDNSVKIQTSSDYNPVQGIFGSAQTFRRSNHYYGFALSRSRFAGAPLLCEDGNATSPLYLRARPGPF